MRAPPESLMPMIGMRFFSARSMTLMTFSANTSPSDPPKTVASWLNSIRSRTLHEHPAVAFQVFGAVEAAVVIVFGLGQDRRAARFGATEVSVDVVDVNEDTIHHVRHRRPTRRLLTAFAVSARTAVVGC